MQWPDQLQNGELLKVAEQFGFEVMVTSDQNIRYQQNLTGRKLALIVLGAAHPQCSHNGHWKSAC